MDYFWYGITPSSKRMVWKYKERQRAIELGLPIPRTGNHRGRYSGYRAPRTFRTNKENSFLHEDEKFYGVKAKRQRLVNAWDDITRGDVYNKNWKRQRKTQWR